MQTRTHVSIVSVERLNAGVVIRFDDGTCVFYSVDLLLAVSAQAVTLNETALTW